MSVAITTLQGLRDGKTLDQLSVQLHDAISAVEHLRKPATVILEIKIAPFGTAGVANMVAMTAEVTSKLPKPDPEQTPFWIDMEGNPTTHQERTRQMHLSIATDERPATKEGTGA